jgi:hypothetical protein
MCLSDQRPDPFGVQCLDRPATHTGAHDRIDFVTGQLVHWVTGTVTVVGITILNYFYIPAAGIDYCKERRRTKMFMDDAFQTGVVAGRYTN